MFAHTHRARFFTRTGSRSTGRLLKSGILVAVLAGLQIGIEAGTKLPNPLNSNDATGKLGTYSTAGGIDQSNPFFQSLGTNGRTCGSCHVSRDAWSITPPDLQVRFNSTQGLDPVFQPVDGANCPSDDVSTLEARQAAYSQLLSKGLIRVSLPVLPSAEFAITEIQDPYNCPETTASQPALYRRPLPSTNLDFLSAVMFDGRETIKNSSGTIDLNASLTQQATDATLGHAQAAAPPTSQQLAQIVAFETALYTAQANDVNAGSLSTQGGQGGPFSLSTQPFYIGINDALGGDPTGAQFNPNVFALYNKWANLNSQPKRQAVARGQALFNTLPIQITGVGGLNDALGQPVINGTCTTCHDSPNVGNHSFSVPLNIGTTAYPALSALDISGLPVYTVQCTDGTPPVQVTDIGRAMISGQCADIGKVKGPILRGLAGRAPYFHNGAAATLSDAVEFYNQRFNLNLTDQQKSDLVAFLQTL
jgi:cytochrome c peroxidase